MKRRLLTWGIVGFVALFPLACLGFIFPLQLLFHLAVGWALHLVRVVPQVRVNPAAVATGVVGLAALAVGTHLFLGWLYGHVGSAGGGERPRWPARWTAAMLGLVVLMFVAGISAVGVTHQAAWLATSPEPLIDNEFRESAARMASMNNLKQMGLGLHTYQDRHGRMPAAAIGDSDGRPLLSWRVAVLPFVEEEKLYAEFRLDEPWDSPHNLRLLPRIPRIYVPLTEQGRTERTATPFRVFTGPGTAFEGNQGLRLPDDFPDGPSKTFLIVEAAEAVLWTKPEELVYDPHGPLPKLGGRFRGRFLAAKADGSVRTFTLPLNEEAVRAAVTRNGGEDVPLD